ncbi:hypothetical protein [Marinigracilibium pacificum]|uniref:Uncharacterized protein n=1 Tax=Marinigracilibium pacificum TaxID=2729599 RepID=A0A848J3L4_9BACT|nr:hypothetical protein [Marinigracilibium pacificum]NMM50326.1 hypothetical protein [Marinigracilibium pacificum]
MMENKEEKNTQLTLDFSRNLINITKQAKIVSFSSYTQKGIDKKVIRNQIIENTKSF